MTITELKELYPKRIKDFSYFFNDALEVRGPLGKKAVALDKILMSLGKIFLKVESDCFINFSCDKNMTKFYDEVIKLNKAKEDFIMEAKQEGFKK